jgi:DNA-binding MarR family transcriptional regulator
MSKQSEPTSASAGVPVDTSIDALIAQVCRMHYRRAHDLFEELGLYRGQPPLLHELWKCEGRTHGELAERLHVQPATITKMLQRMQEAGFVQRRRDTEDQRVSRVYLTATGREIQERVQQVWRQLEDEALAGFTLEERDLLRRFLVQIRDNFGRVHACSHPGKHAGKTQGSP